MARGPRCEWAREPPGQASEVRRLSSVVPAATERGDEIRSEMVRLCLEKLFMVVLSS